MNHRIKTITAKELNLGDWVAFYENDLQYWLKVEDIIDPDPTECYPQQAEIYEVVFSNSGTARYRANDTVYLVL